MFIRYHLADGKFFDESAPEGMTNEEHIRITLMRAMLNDDGVTLRPMIVATERVTPGAVGRRRRTVIFTSHIVRFEII